ncbi:hypothetical protein G6F47_011343 [Rhizopus delemar]|nr:hypothetical protein G6F54_008355 [Rhizopus delemar]KAG1503528.1 hypothetical protein G6F53_010608 [Rhizopus delemar]KAG1586008.1 hypothetical protein G6F47_011343 [Rhizopus delemar]
MSGFNIKVVCRFRPQNKLEIDKGGFPTIEIDENGTRVTLKGETTSSFTFDKVFGMDTTQKDVFDYSIKSIVDDVTAGYNSTIFAYGKTDSGKTFTMMGADINDKNTKGITPRIIEQVFTRINNAPSNIKFTVKLSYMEIYMERVRDLFNPSNDDLTVYEDKTQGVYVNGLYEICVANRDETYQAITYTNMNTKSSHSHSIMVITIIQKDINTGAAKCSKLFLVDLASLKKVGKTNSSEQALEETKKVNKSLSTLHMVINALTDGKSGHVPYRNSKLTHILRESLGGNSRTTFIINCSPSSYNEANTISTLIFGVRAKAVKNKAKANADLSFAKLKALLKKSKTETITFQNYIAALEDEENSRRSGKASPEDKWDMLDEINKDDITTLPSEPNFKTIADDTCRPITPFVTLENDELEESLKREKKLVNQLAEKETELKNCEKLLESSKEEICHYKSQELSLHQENQQFIAEIAELRLQLQKLSAESKEKEINDDSLKETDESVSLTINDTAILRHYLSNAQESLNQYTKTIDSLQKENQALEKNKVEYESRLKKLEEDYEELFSKTVATSPENENTEEATSALKVDLETQYASKNEIQQQEIGELRLEVEELKQVISKKTEDILKLSQNLQSMKEANNSLLNIHSECDKKINYMRKTMDENSANLTAINEALVCKLQLSYEKESELEIVKNEAQEKYDYALKAGSELVEQNLSLKKEISIADRKLAARNERIQQLEALLQHSQEELIKQNRKLGEQINLLRERLQQATSLRSQRVVPVSFARIARPVRGGGGEAAPTDCQTNTLASSTEKNKRGSWI